MKRIFILSFLLISALFPITASAQVSRDVTVTAIVDSKVSKTLSTVTVSARETLADPTSHSILITIKLVDALGVSLPNLNVVLTSSRGTVDIIEDTTKIGTGAPYDDMRKGKTDANGLVSFKISSYYPGKTTISILADQLVIFDPVELQFNPLPFPANVTVTVTAPTFGAGSGNKEFTIYKPPQYETNKLMNNGIKIQIPFWFFLIIALLIIFMPISMIYNFLNLRKIRRMELASIKALQQIEQKEGLPPTPDELKK